MRAGFGAAFSVTTALIVVPSCGSDDQPKLHADAGYDGSGGGAAADAGQPDQDASQASCASDGQCDDGHDCTLDSCADGACKHAVGPNVGATACPTGSYCEVGQGCAPSPVCASVEDCKKVWGYDPCKAQVACNAATATCQFTDLDTDGDGHPPKACGGDDCDDSRTGAYPGAAETCDGIDDDCDGQADNAAKCAAAGEDCIAGKCSCKVGNVCAGQCVDTQSDPHNCGGCSIECKLGSCSNGKCVCSNGLTVCGNVCADLKTSASNCGACGNDCKGNVCVSSKCGQTASEVASFDGRVVTIAVSVSDVWVLTDKRSVYRVVKTGGTPILVAQIPGFDLLRGLAVDSVNAYWVEKTSVTRAPLAGGPPATLMSKSWDASAAWVGANGSSVFWFDGGGTSAGSWAYKAAVSGNPSYPIGAAKAYDSTFSFDAFFVDGTKFYFSESNSKTFRLTMVPEVGNSEWIAPNEFWKIAAITASGGQVWWAMGSQIRTRASQTSSINTLVWVSGAVSHLRYVSSQVVWMAQAGNNTIVARTDTSGSPTAYLGTASATDAKSEAMDVDGTHVYWTGTKIDAGSKATTTLRRAPL